MSPVLTPCRYYEYVFGTAKRQGPYKNRRAGPGELTELQVWITSPDSECDSYPSVTSDESCESFLFLIALKILYHSLSLCGANAEVEVSWCHLQKMNYNVSYVLKYF